MKTTMLVIVVLTAIALLPTAAQAATCADYANQAAAQRAADTRDADGDGIYCESLPCPCLKPGQNTGGGRTSPPPPPQQSTQCGVERWPVKTLTDSSASRVSLTARTRTVEQLRSLVAPAVGRNSPRLAGEFSTYTVRVRLRSMKIEQDSDIHLVVADPTNATHTMIVEFPNAGCVSKAKPTSRRRMTRARAALTRSCGPANTGSFRTLRGTAAITGVAFFDALHGQRGVAPNGIELHPVLSFKATSSCAGR